MKELNIKSETIRDYLLRRISDEKLLVEIEDQLFTDDEFCDQVELVEDELINDYEFGKLNKEDASDFEKSLENNPERISKVEFADLLKEKAKTEKVVFEEKAILFDSIRAFLKQPMYAGVFGVLMVAVLFSAVYFLLPRSSDELASLKDIYKTERPITSRVSDFEYAPYVAERSENSDDANKNKLRLIENNLLEGVEKDENAATLHALGVFYLTQAKYEEAIKNLQKAVELQNNNAKYRNDLGTAYFEFAKNGDKDERLQNLGLANEEFSKAVELDGNLLEALFNRALVLEALNLPQQTQEAWNEYLEKDSKSKWADEAREHLKTLSQRENSFKTKEEVLEAFMNAYRKKDEARIWQIHNDIKGIFSGVSLQEQLTKEFILASKQSEDRRAGEYLEALKMIGELEKEKHADFFFAELAEYYSKVDSSKFDELLKGKDLQAEGVKFISTGKYVESVKKFEESKITFQNADNVTEAIMAEMSVAEMLPDLNRYDESIEKITSIIEIAKSKNYKIILPVAYYWLGISNFRQGFFSKAIGQYKIGIEIARKNENNYEIIHSANNLSEIYFEFGEIANASEYINESQNFSSTFYANKGQTFRDLLGLYDLFEKSDYLTTSIDVAKENLLFSRQYLSETEALNNSLKNLTNSLAKNKQFNEALKIAVESNELSLKRGENPENIKVIAETYFDLGNLKREMQNCSEGIFDFEKAIENYQKIPQTIYNLFNVHKGKLLCLQQQNRNDEFQNELNTILKLSENYRQNIREDTTRQAFFTNEQEVFDAAITDALNRKAKEKAFEYLETSKARSLLDFVKSEKSITEIEKDYSDISKPLNIEEIQQKMPENVQIVQYSLQNDRLAIWIVTKDKFELIEKKIELAEFENKINSYRKAIIEKGDKQKLEKPAKELYEMLIPKGLETGKSICLIPDKSLLQIPFASLIAPNGKYLIEEFALLYSPSSSVFVLASENAKLKEKETNERLLSIGNPTFDRKENPNLADLPSAEIEAENIAKDYKDSEVLIGENATKVSFLKKFESDEIIHFAGHYVANSFSPGNSKLVFADESLRSNELSTKRLKRAKLVVLSACETGFDAVNKSEGAIGIGRTFLAMGTPMVVASNWKVDSDATKDLMISFHKKRRIGKLTTIEALQQAQLEMLKSEKFNHPVYWSAFSMTGGLADY